MTARTRLKLDDRVIGDDFSQSFRFIDSSDDSPIDQTGKEYRLRVSRSLDFDADPILNLVVSPAGSGAADGYVSFSASEYASTVYEENYYWELVDETGSENETVLQGRIRYTSYLLDDPVYTPAYVYISAEEIVLQVLMPENSEAAVAARVAAENAQTASEEARDTTLVYRNEVDTQHGEVATNTALAQTARTEAQAARDKAEDWAEKGENIEVETGKYSAKHHALKAAASEANAGTSESNAETYKNQAQQALANVQVIFDNFDDRYLGAKASDPATDNDGDPLIAGQVYWNTTDSNVRFYNGNSWEAPSASAAASAAAALASEQAASGHESASSTSEQNAAASEAKSEQWAEEPEDSEVETGKYSALHHSAKAEGHSATASGHKDAAAASESKSQEWAQNPEDTEVETGQYSALHHAAKASAHKDAAGQSETNAGNSETAAGNSATKAQEWAENPEDTEVETGKYSSLHHAAKAAGHESAAQGYASDAENAATSVQDAQAKLDSVEYGAKADQTGPEIKALYEAEANTNAYTDVEKTKVGYLTVTQGVDLDAIYSRVNALDSAVVLKGEWDASTGTFPGGGSAQSGESWIVSVAGTVDGVAFDVNDRIISIADNASTSTFDANWHKSDYTDQVLSVAGKTGAVTLNAADITNFSEAVDDRVNGLIVAGTDISVTYDDVAGTLTIDYTGSGVQDGDYGDISVAGASWTVDSVGGVAASAIQKIKVTEDDGGSLTAVSDWDSLNSSGFYDGNGLSNQTPHKSHTWQYTLHQRHRNTNGYSWELAKGFDVADPLSYRTEENGAWSDWYKVVAEDVNGQVGIGIGTPARGPLHIHEPSGPNELHMTNTGSGSTNNDGLTIFLDSDPLTNGAGIWLREDGPLRFATNGTERGRFESWGLKVSGDINIESATPIFKMVETDGPSGYNQFHIVCSAGVTYFQTRDSAGNYLSNHLRMEHGASGVTQFQFYPNGVEKVRINSSGLHVYDDIEGSGNVILDNNQYFRGRDTGGAARNLIGMSSGNDTIIGTTSTSNRVVVEGGTSGASLVVKSDNNIEAPLGSVRTDQLDNYGGQQLVLTAGESRSYISGLTSEAVYAVGESGLIVHSSPDNWSSGWAGRKTATICDSAGNSSFPGSVSIESIPLQDSDHRSGILEVGRKGSSGWSGIGISHAGGFWNFMSQTGQAGIYNDADNQWCFRASANSYADLYHAGTSKLRTRSDGVEVFGDVFAEGGAFWVNSGAGAEAKFTNGQIWADAWLDIYESDAESQVFRFDCNGGRFYPGPDGGGGRLIQNGTGNENITYGVGATDYFWFTPVHIRPDLNLVQDMGHSSYHFDDIYVRDVIGPSDGRMKTIRSEFSEQELRAWSKVRKLLFQWNDSIEKKGEAARYHAGFIAQEVIQAFEDEGLDVFQYGFITRNPETITEEYDELELCKCTEIVREPYDAIEVIDGKAYPVTKYKEVEKSMTVDVPLMDENGDPVLDENDEQVTYPCVKKEERLVKKTREVPTGEYRYGMRYTQAMVWETAYLRQQMDIQAEETALLKQTTELLTSRVASLEAAA